MTEKQKETSDQQRARMRLWRITPGGIDRMHRQRKLKALQAIVRRAEYQRIGQENQ